MGRDPFRSAVHRRVGRASIGRQRRRQRNDPEQPHQHQLGLVKYVAALAITIDCNKRVNEWVNELMNELVYRSANLVDDSTPSDRRL